jgi:5'(3')-deoxyribonucleotidase
MRLRQLYEDGRIVKGVNTTPDVDVNSISKEAAKFGFKVDKDGRPQNHPSKVKGSKTNVLFNLGLTESVAIKFERGNDYDILHIKEKGKNRVEVRGKGGYESGNYDPKDKLHRLLDKLGKAANISELMNGETVVLNPKHPDGPNAIDNLTDLEEALGEIASATEIYVDMDGVLADFFGDWAKLMGVDSFRDIKDVNAALEKIKDTKDFWLNLPVTDNAKPLLELIKKVKGEYSICSSPLPGDKNSEPHKREWIKKHLAFFPPKEIIITHDKAKYATQPDGTSNILIDDYGVNINAWEAAGGIGFKHKDHKFERTAKNIKQHMDADVEEGSLIPNPKNTFLAKSDTAYDHYKLGTNIANLKSVKKGGNYDEPDVVIAPYAGKKEMKYLQKQLTRIGYDVQDADGYQDAHYDEEPTGGEAPPQMKGQGPLGKVKVSKLKGVQKERSYKKLAKQLERVLEDDYAPLQIDRKGRVVNGHHRLDALRLVGEEYARVHMIDDVVENVKETYADEKREKTKRTLAKHDKAMIKVARDSIKKYEKDKEDKETNENFADGKKKGKSRPGRVKKSGASCNGSVTSLRKKAKNASGERAKMYHWCANMKGGKK